MAVLGPAPGDDFDAPEIPWVGHDDPRAILAPLAARAYRVDALDERLVGVTGTNGKSTVSALVAAVLEAAGEPCGVIGTLGARLGETRFAIGDRTTPEAPDLFRALRRMADAGARAVSMEVSSIALDAGRVDGLAFDVAVFTNLTRDHLDYHGGLDEYFAAKRSLFDRLAPEGVAVVHVGDPRGRELAADLREHGTRLVTFGISEGDVYADDATLDLLGVRARLVTPRGPLVLRSPLLGRYNLENLLAAVAVGEALGIERETIARGIAGASPLPGRLEAVRRAEEPPFPALVDYAHTPGALEAALGSVREIADGRKIAVVFGCGGDRDRGKRRPMGEAAGRLADFVVVTSDNPRSEDPQTILAEAADGVRAAGAEPVREVDRRAAIRRAVERAARGERDGERWLVLVAGKGHETTQTIGDRTIDFDDREELERAIGEEARHG